ncbi:hypothetical protein MANES_09G118425v8 [Manihot esculenta]|nr:hypothetical protein MANES_09G118425v8 [Manihot esculenta]
MSLAFCFGSWLCDGCCGCLLKIDCGVSATGGSGTVGRWWKSIYGLSGLGFYFFIYFR